MVDEAIVVQVISTAIKLTFGPKKLYPKHGFRLLKRTIARVSLGSAKDRPAQVW